MIALSFSRWKWTQCPYAFNALYIAKSHKEPESEPMLVGREFADIAREYRKHCYRVGVSSDLGFFEQAIIKHERTMTLIKQFSRSQFAILPMDASNVMIERQMAFDKDLMLIHPKPGQQEKDAWFSKSAAFRIIPDFSYRSGDTLTIIDDKTGYGDADELQLRVMAALIYRTIPAMEASGLTRVRGYFNFVAKCEDPLPVEFGIGDLGGIASDIQDKLALVNSWKDYPAIACEQCGNCTVPDCPLQNDVTTALTEAFHEAVPDLRLPTEIRNQADAECSLLFRVFLANIDNRIGDLQRTWVEEHGPIIAGGKRLAFDEVETWKPKSFEDLSRAMMGYGVTKEQIVKNISFTKSAIVKTMKRAKKESRIPFLMQFIEIGKYKKFSIKNEKDEGGEF